MHATGPIHLLLVGAPGTEFRLAATMAQEAGARVNMADDATMALSFLRDEGSDLVMIDIDEDIAGFIRQLRSERMALPVLACGIDATADQAVAAIRAGARDYVPLPPHADLIAAAIYSVAHHGTRLIGKDPAMARAVALALAMAHSSAPVLIVGDAGTGKQLLARTVHESSGRRGKFLVVDCADCDPEVLESELFGHAEGAFPGAVADRRGRIDEAADGTLFLRDVDALAPALQSRLLSRLQGQTGHRTTTGNALPNVRIVAATRTDLDSLVSLGQFNATLLARLGLVRIALPPLRSRRSDIMPMARYFAERYAQADALPRLRFRRASSGIARGSRLGGQRPGTGRHGAPRRPAEPRSAYRSRCRGGSGWPCAWDTLARRHHRSIRHCLSVARSTTWNAT